MPGFDLTPDQAFLTATATTEASPDVPVVVYELPETEPLDPQPEAPDREAQLREWEDERYRRRQQREDHRRAKRALLEVSPAGRHATRAEEAWTHGDAYYQVVLSLGAAEARWGDHVSSKDLQPDPVGPILTVIQDIGWKLEHTGYVSNATGEILGVFLFRRPEAGSTFRGHHGGHPGSGPTRY